MREYRILHLEDSHSDADVIKRVLLKANLNFQYFFADDKESFIRGLTDFKPDVILCDHALPQFDSVMAFDIYKEMKFEIPFILVTGSVSEEYAVEMIKKGIDDYLLKTNLQRLPQAIKSAFDKRENEKKIKEGIKKLENSESRMKEAQKIAHLGNWELDFETRIGIWSDETCRIYGLSPEDNKQTFEIWISFIHPDDLEYVMKIVNETQKTLVVSKMNHRIVLKDGTIKHVTSESKFNIDSTGKPIGIYGIVHDITERKKAEESLRQSETNLLAIFENTNTGFLLLDTLFNIISFNNQINHFAKILFGFELQGKQNLISLLLPERQKEFAGMFSAVIKGNNINNETSYPLTDGSIIWYHLSGNCVLDTNGKAVGICLAINDITEKKEAEQKLEQQNKELAISNTELEQFAYVASHDLQEPLRMVSSFLNLLEKRMDGQLDETNRQYIDFAVDGTRRMKSLIMALLEYSRVGTNKEDFAPVDLNEVVQYVTNVLDENIKKNTALITFKFLPVITANKTLITHLFLNLVNNALKYHGDKEPVIEIGSTEDKDWYIFYVKDNGIGIDPKFFDKIFIIFQRLHNKSEYSGTGIGLAICKKIVEIHKGKIWVESEPGKGSTFYFSIPETKHNA